RSIIVWGLVVPLLALGLAWPTRGASLLLLGGYGLLAWRVYRYGRVHRGWRPADARAYAFFVIVGKFAGAVGLARYWLGRFTGRRSRVIDFRGPVSAGASASSRAGG